MNPLTEMMIEQKTHWALPENKEMLRQEILSAIGDDDVVRIEDTLYPDGRVSKYGSRVRERRFYFSDGKFFFINTFRGRVALDPLPKNPLTLEDVEGEYWPLG